ncbi:MAG: class I SAM-dependent methyltransferase, partial [Bdellovibrionales bacterium]|nr:class I SAM-dependent methyltransferase [Bdellovibrionales bacterium]
MSTNSGDNKEKSLKPKKYWRVPEFFPELSKEQQEKLLAYQTELIHFNGRINLISARTEQEADIIHMADCIKASQLILKGSQQKEIFDIGSGNGLPGIVMAILDAERKIVVVDKDARKMEFLKHLCSRLDLK